MREITTIVIHHSVTPQLWSVQKTIDLIDSEHKNRLHPKKNGLGYHIAYHYVLFHDGIVRRTRPLNEVGYHAGDLPVNNKSIGICLAGNFEDEKPHEAQLEILKELINTLKKEHNIVSIKLHRDIKPTKCPGKNFTHKMLRKLIAPKISLARRIRRMEILKRFFN